MHFTRLVVVVFLCMFLGACGDDAPQQIVSSSPPPVAPSGESLQKASSPQKAPVSTSAGGVSVQIIPENPTSTACLRAVIQGIPGSKAITWKVNDKTVATGTDARLCDGSYKRYDLVTVTVGTTDQGGQASVSIVNSPPHVVDISSTPAEIFAGTDVSVSPVAEDADDDMVDFRYQWLINGNADPLLTQATLPGNRFSKGDTIQVQIIPNDFFVDGPTYESYAQPVPNAAPRITSAPPQGIESLDYRYQVKVSDPDDQTFTFRLVESPAGMTIDATSGLIQWSLVGVTPGDYKIVIIASDPAGAETAQEYSLTLGAPQ